MDQTGITSNQWDFLNRFLVEASDKVFKALELMFELNISSSTSTIEISTAQNSEKLPHWSGETLYTVSSSLSGGFQGDIHLLLRSADFKYLSEALKPILSLIFFCSSDADLATLDSQKPLWMQEDNEQAGNSEDAAFHRQMMDTLTEIGNVVFGIYTKTIYQMCVLNSHHSAPDVLKKTQPTVVQQLLSPLAPQDQLHLTIENEFVVMNRPIRFLSLISPTRGALYDALEGAESHYGKLK